MSRLGNNIIAEVYGESHSARVGVKISGVPSGYVIDSTAIQSDLDRRSAAYNLYSTPRKESDKLVIESGLIDGFSSGSVIEGYIANDNINATSYRKLLSTPRPGHADYVARMKYGDSYNSSGGGAFSGRLTAPMVIMGSVARQILAKHDIHVFAYISQLGSITCGSYDMAEQMTYPRGELPIRDKSKLPIVTELLERAVASGDSVGGKIECVVQGIPVGIGDAMWAGLESQIACGLYGVPAVKAVEFGSGVNMATMRGSEANDCFYYENGIVRTRTNHNGGINGGISNGMDINLRVTIKPTPSISIEQDTVNLDSRNNEKLSIKGRHDCCILPRAVVVVESIVAYILMDIMKGESRL